MARELLKPRYDNVLNAFLSKTQDDRFRRRLSGIHCGLTETLDEVAVALLPRNTRWDVNTDGRQFSGCYPVGRIIKPAGSDKEIYATFHGGLDDTSGAYRASVETRNYVPRSSDTPIRLELADAIPYSNLLLKFWFVNAPQVDFSYVFARNVPDYATPYFEKHGRNRWTFDCYGYKNARVEVSCNKRGKVSQYLWDNRILLPNEEARQISYGAVAKLPDRYSVGISKLATLEGFETGLISVWAFVANKISSHK